MTPSAPQEMVSCFSLVTLVKQRWKKVPVWLNLEVLLLLLILLFGGGVRVTYTAADWLK